MASIRGRKRRKTTHRATATHSKRKHHRRRSYHHNPSFSPKGVVSLLKRGVGDGVGVLAGRVGSRWLPDMLGVSGMIEKSSMGSTTSTAALAAVQLLAGIGVAFAAKTAFRGGDVARFVVAGAVDGVIEDVATSFSAQVPLIGKYLGSYSALANNARAANAPVMERTGSYSGKPRASLASYSGGAERASLATRRIGGVAGGRLVTV